MISFISSLSLVVSVVCIGNANGDFQSSASVYKSMKSLDHYGSSPQINNAQYASKLHAPPTVVAYSRASLIVTSLTRKQPNLDPHCKCNVIGKSKDFALVTIGSGLTGDAAFMNRLLRQDVMYTWERYDALPKCSRVAATASKIMLAFMGYDDEIRDGTFDILLDEKGKRLKIGRPLAVDLIVAEIKFSDGYIDSRRIDPSGVVFDEVWGGVLGRGSEEGTILLKKRWKGGMEETDVEDLCIDIIRKISRNDHLLLNQDTRFDNDCEYLVVVEIFDQKGHRMKTVPLVK